MIETLLWCALYVCLLPASLIFGFFDFPLRTFNLSFQSISIILHGHTSITFLTGFKHDVVKFQVFSQCLVPRVDQDAKLLGTPIRGIYRLDKWHLYSVMHLVDSASAVKAQEYSVVYRDILWVRKAYSWSLKQVYHNRSIENFLGHSWLSRTLSVWVSNRPSMGLADFQLWLWKATSTLWSLG